MVSPTLADLIRRAAGQRGAETALTFPGGSLTYGELDDRTNRVANALAGSGVGAGDRVALLARNGPLYFDVLFGAAKLNAALAGLNWRLSPAELRVLLENVGARVLLVDEDCADQLRAMEALGPRDRERQIVFGPGGDHLRPSDWMASFPGSDPEAVAEPDDLAVLVYTSGTTGAPHGVEITHAALAFLLPRAAGAYRFDSTSVNLAAMPFFHVSGSGWSLVCLHQGGRVVIVPGPDPGGTLETIEAEGVTHMSLVTSVVQFLLGHPRCPSTDLSSLQLVAYGGSPAPPGLIVRAAERFGCDLVQLYGLSETAGAVTELPAADHDPRGLLPERLLSCGVPYDWVEVKVADPVSGAALPVGATGELCVRAPHVMRGYRGRPDETAAVLSADGWLRTGDAARLDADGYVFLVDRIRDMIISGGENVYPVEVERILAEHPAVAEVAVVGVPDDRWGEVPRAVIVPAPETEAGAGLAAELISWCRERLAHYKCPAAVDFVAGLPRTASGKVSKRELRAPFWAGRRRMI